MHLQQTLHAIFTLGPHHRQPAVLAGVQAQDPNRRRREPSLRQRIQMVRGQLASQPIRVQAVVFLFAVRLDFGRVHPVRAGAPIRLFQNTHDEVAAGCNDACARRCPPGFPQVVYFS
jgi:hypothetical protein